jgi:hypothetical protein
VAPALDAELCASLLAVVTEGLTGTRLMIHLISSRGPGQEEGTRVAVLVRGRVVAWTDSRNWL